MVSECSRCPCPPPPPSAEAAPPRASSGKLRRAKSREGEEGEIEREERGRDERTVSCAIAAVNARRKEERKEEGRKEGEPATDRLCVGKAAFCRTVDILGDEARPHNNRWSPGNKV